LRTEVLEFNNRTNVLVLRDTITTKNLNLDDHCCGTGSGLEVSMRGFSDKLSFMVLENICGFQGFESVIYKDAQHGVDGKR